MDICLISFFFIYKFNIWDERNLVSMDICVISFFFIYKFNMARKKKKNLKELTSLKTHLM